MGRKNCSMSRTHAHSYELAPENNVAFTSGQQCNQYTEATQKPVHVTASTRRTHFGEAAFGVRAAILEM